MSSAPTKSSGTMRPLLKGPPTSESLLCRIKYNNTLPDIPFDPKFLVNPLDLTRFVPYTTTSLEREAKHDLLVPQDLGVDINLMLPERYECQPNAELDPGDQKLIVDGDETPGGPTAGHRNPKLNPKTLLHNKVVPWLKRTEYISTEFNRYGASSEKTETKVGYKIQKGMAQSTFMDKDSQIAAINQTFEASKKPIEKHHSKPDVHPVRMMPVLPDFENWRHTFVQVIFDNEPVDSSRTAQMEQAIIRGTTDEQTQEAYVGYFLPTEITMTERLMELSNNIDYTSEKEYEYKLTREYNWKTTASQGKEDNYFLSFFDDVIYFNPLETRVRLTKRRTKMSNAARNTTLLIKHRPFNDQELRSQELRLVQLEPPGESKDEREDMQEDEDSHLHEELQ